MQIEAAALATEKSSESRERHEQLKREIADRDEKVNALKAKWQAEKEILSGLKPLQEEIDKLRAEGPSAEELEKAKKYLIGSYALQGRHAFIYIRGEFDLAHRRMADAIEEAYTAGLLGENILGTGYDLDLYVQIGAGAYICGEETALLESLEGIELPGIAAIKN